MPNYYLLHNDETIVSKLKRALPTNTIRVISHGCLKNIKDCFIQTSPRSYRNSILESSFIGQDEETNSIDLILPIHSQADISIIVRIAEKK